jgi:hypothetical protein
MRLSTDTLEAFLDAHRRLIVWICLGLLLGLGLATFRDYGISWDEPTQRTYGEMVYDYVTKQDTALLADRHRHYGPAPQLLLHSLERGLRLEDTRSVYMMRHLVTFLVFWAGAVFFYLLARRLFGSWKLGLVGCAFLVLSPRIFAHSFYNPKDIPLMSVFIIGIYTLVSFLDRPGLGRAAVHAAVCAVLVCIRIGGIMLPAITLAFGTWEILRDGLSGRRIRQAMLSLAVYTIAVAGLTVLMWPTLWRQPLRAFIEAFREMSHFQWPGTVLYLGSQVPAQELPWHYVPVWMAISIPLAYLVLFGIGAAVGVHRIFKSSGPPVPGRRNSMVILAWLFVPPAYSILTGAVLYDGWRQLYFVHPALILLSVSGLRWLWARFRTASGWPGRIACFCLLGMLLVNLGGAAHFMIASHPHQAVYFNSLAGGIRGAEGRFELDYWGLSYRAALEHILANDERDVIKVYVVSEPGRHNAMILTPDERRRIVFVDRPVKANYYLTTYRWQDAAGASGDEVYSIEVGGAKIMAVYRIRHT